jgi:hypothetical protein
MGFVPDPYCATVRIGTRWCNGKPTSLNEQPLPRIQDGTLVELVLPAWALTKDDEREELTLRRTLEMLAKDSRVFLGLSPRAVPRKYHEIFRSLKRAVAAASYLLAEIVLMEPLGITIDGSQRAVLEPCRCRISLLNREATSLNHAFTMLSHEFEPDRISHGGNVFRKGFVCLNGNWVSLDDVRFARVAEFLRTIHSESDDALGANGITSRSSGSE